MTPSIENYRHVLMSEFRAEPGSFLLQLHDRTWDKSAFRRLTSAMEICCEQNNGTLQLERWMAAGFWFLPYFVRGQLDHPEFPLPGEREYYFESLSKLETLADRFFSE